MPLKMEPESLKRLSQKSLKRTLHLFSPIHGQFPRPDPKTKRIRLSHKVVSEFSGIIKTLQVPQPSTGSGNQDTKQGAQNSLLVGPSMFPSSPRIPSSSSSSSGFRSHRPWKMYRVISGHKGTVMSVAFDPSNQWFCTGSADRTIKIWDLASGTLKLSLTGHIGQIRGLAVSKRNPYMFSAADDKQVKCWDLEHNTVIKSYHGHSSGIYCLALHPTNDNILVTGGRDSVCRVWDIRSRQQTLALSGHDNTVCSVLTRPTDPQVVTGSHDSTIRFWDIRNSGKAMSTLTHHKKSVRAMALAPDPRDHSIVSASTDNIKKFNLPRGEFLHNYHVLSQRNTSTGTIINSMAVNEDGVLATAGDNGSLWFWDWKSGYNVQQAQTIAQPGSLDCEESIFALAYDVTESSTLLPPITKMNHNPPYPPIDPTTFDLIVIGTGLPESILSAAASTASKSVLHLDPNPFYGSHFSSLPLSDLTSFLTFHSTSPSPDGHLHDFTVLDFATRPLYSSVDISNFAPQLLHQHSRKFNIDVAGPRVLFCADQAIDLMLKSGASQYMEFKSIDATFVGDGKGNLWTVPDSRAAIFKDKSLGLMEKNQLMRFFKLVQGHLAGEEASKVSEEDLQTPFVDFLNKMGLPPKIKSFILYAIAMADYDQGDGGDLLKTKHGIDQLALYSASIGRFQNAPGAMIYPVYGQGELCQAFCRRAAVKGCLYVLRMPVTSLLIDKESGGYKGVRLASGQDIFSKKLILDPSFTVPSLSGSSSPNPLQGKLPLFNFREDRRKVARGICITKSSLKPDISNILIVYPPRSLFPEQVTSIRLLQIGSNLAVCPPGMFVLYISTLCSSNDQGKKLLNAVINTLLTIPDSINSESNAAVQSETVESGCAVQNETAESSLAAVCDPGEGKPTVLWSALYIQELSLGQVDFICSTPMPDGDLNYNNVVDASVKLFQHVYPDEEFFPEIVSSENSEDDGGVALET
ncbi:hypothetical protein COLO4_10588 [Corchorus olitorius]|uniref:Uncharacterized protein n=1 Tax=Corchorus olitorius TaxID=93759 RepID=A0A1R3K7Z8_9ROSI|nr:hypothetical protein COLO4_10588 [Corchorus olitorius]